MADISRSTTMDMRSVSQLRHGQASSSTAVDLRELDGGLEPSDAGTGRQHYIVGSSKNGNGKIAVLLVEDNPDDALLVEQALAERAGSGFRLSTVDRVSAAIHQLGAEGADLVWLDLGLPDGDGLDSIHRIHAAFPKVPIVALTDDGDEKTGLAAVKAGAQDYLVKDRISSDLLIRVSRYALERHNAQVELGDSERFLRTIFNGLCAQVALIDESGTIIAANQAWKAYAATSPLALVSGVEGDNYIANCENAAIQDFPQGKEFAAGIRSIISGCQHHFTMEHALAGPGGREWFHSFITPVQNHGRRQVVVSLEQITAKKLALENLKASEARLLQIFDASPNCVSIRNHDGRYIMANQAVADLYMLPAAEMVGKTDIEIFHRLGLDPQLAVDSLSEDHRVIASGETHRIQEAPFVRPDGSVRWFSTIKTPIAFPCDPHCVLEIAVDISEQHKAREALRNSELRLRTILDALTSSVVHLDLDLKVLWPNQAACAGAQMSRTAIIGQSCYSIWFNRKTACPDCPVQAAMAEGSPQLRQKKSADGKTWRILGCPVKDDAGQIVSFVEVAEEISDRLKMEAQLRQSQKMESLGTLAGGIAHDFNNILAAILGYTELAIHEKQKTEGTSDFLKEIYKAGERAKDLVRQILTFSRRGDTKLQPLRIELIVKEALKLLRSSLPTTINIVQKIEPDLDPILADPIQIHQIIMNLCTNASHAMTPDGGELVVSLAHEALGRETFRRLVDLKPGHYLKLTISDTGCGMTPEIMAAIFDPYFTTKDLGEGTGLGLAVVHGIVQEYGGDIRVQSEPGKGTTFSLYFPAIKAKTTISNRDDTILPRGGSERILVVDDEPSILKVIQRHLTVLGYRATAERDSQQALALFTADPTAFDLVLSDMTMPKMTGDRLARAILSIRPDIPVILCTGYNRHIDAQQAKAAGIGALLMKPVSQRNLASEIRRLLDKPPNKDEVKIKQTDPSDRAVTTDAFKNDNSE